MVFEKQELAAENTVGCTVEELVGERKPKLSTKQTEPNHVGSFFLVAYATLWLKGVVGRFSPLLYAMVAKILSLFLFSQPCLPLFFTHEHHEATPPDLWRGVDELTPNAKKKTKKKAVGHVVALQVVFLISSF